MQISLLLIGVSIQLHCLLPEKTESEDFLLLSCISSTPRGWTGVEQNFPGVCQNLEVVGHEVEKNGEGSCHGRHRINCVLPKITWPARVEVETRTRAF